MASAPNITHNYYNNPSSIGWKVTTTDYVTVSAAFVVVLARCYTKFFLLKSRGWDDCMSTTNGTGRKTGAYLSQTPSSRHCLSPLGVPPATACSYIDSAAAVTSGISRLNGSTTKLLYTQLLFG